jgi:hypothetical protein
VTDIKDVINVVFKKGLLLDVTIGRWAAIHYMRPIDLLLHADVNQKAMHLGHKKLMPASAMAELVTVEGQIRKFVMMHSTPFPIAGAVFVTYKALPELLKGMKKLEKKFAALADDLVAEYEGAKKAQLNILHLQAEKIAAPHFETADEVGKTFLKQWLLDQDTYNRTLYPPKEELRSKFYVSRRMFKVDPIGAGTVDDSYAGELAAQETAFHKDMAKWVTSSTVTNHTDLGKAVTHAQKLMEDQGKLNPKNLVALFNALVKFESGEFAGSPWTVTVNILKSEFLVTKSDGSVDYSAISTMVNGAGKEKFMGCLELLAPLATDKVSKNAATEMLLASDFKRVLDI